MNLGAVINTNGFLGAFGGIGIRTLKLVYNASSGVLPSLQTVVFKVKGV